MFQTLKNKYYRNAPMVSYWKHGDSVEGKVYQTKDGHYEMKMKGEKFPFQGVPRGILLFGKLSPLKHQIKNKIFNETWRMLEEKVPESEIRSYLDSAWEEIFALAEETRYDMLPYEKMIPVVKEIYRAMTKIGCDDRLRDTLCFIFQEDDAYRNRMQWVCKFLPWFRKPLVIEYLAAVKLLEEGESVGDMKERERLFHRVFTFMVKENPTFARFVHEVDWRKVALTNADKYFLRAKYFKCDWPEYKY